MYYVNNILVKNCFFFLLKTDENFLKLFQSNYDYKEKFDSLQTPYRKSCRKRKQDEDLMSDSCKTLFQYLKPFTDEKKLGDVKNSREQKINKIFISKNFSHRKEAFKKFKFLTIRKETRNSHEFLFTE